MHYVGMPICIILSFYARAIQNGWNLVCKSFLKIIDNI
jgi:hypothetical protein